MKFKYLIVLATFTAFHSSQTFAEDSKIGIGSGIFYGQQISIPINYGSFFVEPTISVYSDKSEAKTANIRTRKTETLDAGIGIFGKNRVLENTFIYYGSRFGYQKITRDRERSTSISKETSTGLYAAPTFGVEYYLMDKLSLGLDIAFRYIVSDVKSSFTDTTINDTQNEDRNETRLVTTSILMIRYYF